MGFWALLFLTASLGVFYVNLYLATQDVKRFWAPGACSLIVLVLCVLSNVLKLSLGKVDGVGLYPVLDMLAGLVALAIFAPRPQVWSGVLVLSFVVLNVVHAGYAHESWVLKGSAPDFSAYALKLNVLTAVQLLALLIPGGAHVAVRIGGRLPLRIGRRRGLGMRSGE